MIIRAKSALKIGNFPTKCWFPYTKKRAYLGSHNSPKSKLTMKEFQTKAIDVWSRWNNRATNWGSVAQIGNFSKNIILSKVPGDRRTRMAKRHHTF